MRLDPTDGIMIVKEILSGQSEEWRKGMTEALQAAINEGARHSWKLVGVTQDPTADGDVILVWDTSGFFSG
jgi:hypothetical protein